MLGESSLEQDSSWKSVPHERIVKSYGALDMFGSYLLGMTN